MKQQNKTKQMVQLAMFATLIIVLATIPGLGYIPLGVVNATTVHIPVIIGSILLGPVKGGILGFIFALTSFIKATIAPNLTSFVFTPFYSFSPEFSGNLWSLVICFVPRILTGVVPYYINLLLTRNKTKPSVLSLATSGFLGSMTNTLLVMNMIYIFFGESYGTASGLTTGIYAAITTIICINGIPEAIVAAILTTVLCKTLIPILKRYN